MIYSNQRSEPEESERSYSAGCQVEGSARSAGLGSSRIRIGTGGGSQKEYLGSALLPNEEPRARRATLRPQPHPAAHHQGESR